MPNNNSAKIFADGADYLIEKNDGNVIIKSDGVYPTTRTGNTLVEVPWDITTFGALNNAIEAMETKVSTDTAKGLRPLFFEKMEDYDSPEE